MIMKSKSVAAFKVTSSLRNWLHFSVPPCSYWSHT